MAAIGFTLTITFSKNPSLFHTNTYCIISAGLLLFALFLCAFNHFSHQKSKTLLLFGTALVLFTLFFKTEDTKKYRVILFSSQETHLALSENKNIVELPFGITLDSIHTKHYSSGQLQQLQAHISIQKQGNQLAKTLEMNHPIHFEHYDLYLAGFSLKKESPIITLQLINQPGKSITYIGFGLIFAAIVLFFISFFKKIKWRIISTKSLIFTISLALLFSLIYLIINIIKPNIRFTELSPQLQSCWFFPHIVFYMISYTLLAIALIFFFLSLIKRQDHHFILCDKCARVGTLCFAIGLLLGAIWAKSAWGYFWTWDPKENWALLTLLLYWLYLTLRKHFPQQKQISASILCLGFLSLQMCWYGLKLLSIASVHLYN
ncbi:MAG: cytochrome c biogenesis protein CcsA [Bacteroidales bacterium]|nr:cytochrome c biogenesis protein CcsA [Bacteroidales bacterium]